MRPTTPLLLLSLALLVSSVTITSATPSAFVVPPGPGRQRFHQPLLSRLSSRGVSLRLSSPPSVVVLSSSSPQKEGASKTGAEKLGPQGQSLNLTTANATAAAFDLLIDTIENWATVIGDRQDLCKEEIIDRLDEWMQKINADQRLTLARLEQINKDVNRVAILVVICFGVNLATMVPAWFAAK